MKIGIMVQAYETPYGLAEGMRMAKKHGYDCIDDQILANTDTPLFCLPEKDFIEELKKRRHVIEEAGLTVSQTHGPWRYPIHDYSEYERAERVEKMILAIKGTAALGCENFVIHYLMPYGDVDAEGCEEIVRAVNANALIRLCAAAREVGVNVCLENMPFTKQFLAKPADTLAFIREIGMPNLKFTLDTGHAAVFGLSPADAVRAAGKDLQVMHVHDNDGARDCHWLPGTGVIDWEDFAESLREIGFDGTVSLETGVPASIPREEREEQEIALARSVAAIAGKNLS